jgi:hypothetical protein
VVRCQALSDERVMGDAAMNVAASGGGSGSGSGSGGGGGQRIVKEGWLQKRGTVDAICVSYELPSEFPRVAIRFLLASFRASVCHSATLSRVRVVRCRDILVNTTPNLKRAREPRLCTSPLIARGCKFR